MMIYPKTYQSQRNTAYQSFVLISLVSVFILFAFIFYGQADKRSHSSTQPQLLAPGELPKGLTHAEWNHLQGLIHETEYHFALHTPTSDYPAGYYWAPNRTQGWQTTFYPQGVKVTPENGMAWSWGLTLTGYGYGSEAWHPLASNTPVLQADKNQLFYLWDDNLSEWWINNQHGLEQGFTLQQRPVGQTADTPLTLEMVVTGDLTPHLHGDTIFFQDGSGATVLTYDKLYVFDAHGRTIPARFVLPSPDTLQIQVDDHTAVYPLTIDPWVERAKLTSSDGQSGDSFSRSIAISGDTIVVGAPLKDDGGDAVGAAYVFVQPNNGWASTTETAKLTASDGAAGDNFGSSVSISGDTIVVGAYLDDIVGTDSGSAYVFVEPVGGWVNATETAKLTASDAADGDGFGRSIAMDNDTIAVGAYQDDGSQSNIGSIYIFEEPAGGWVNTTEIAKLTTSDSRAGDELGYSVAINVDTVVAGARHNDVGVSNSGAAYVFVEPGGGWANATETAKLTASDAGLGDNLGFSVGISGDTIVAGAYEDNHVSTGAGSAYVFVEPGGGWVNATETAKLTASDAAGNDNFGFSVAISDNVILVGAPHNNDAGFISGSAYIFARPAGGWATTANETIKLTASDAATPDRFGFTVIISGNTAVVGSLATNGNTGGAYVFDIPSIAGGVTGGLGPGGVGHTDGTTPLAAWWRADAGITESGGNVTGWADQSGNGNHADGAGHTPTFVATDANFNNQPVIDFDGNDDYFSYAGLTTPFTESTWYATFESDLIPAGCCESLLAADGTPTGFVHLGLETNDLQFNVGNRNPVAVTSSAAWSANTPYFVGGLMTVTTSLSGKMGITVPPQPLPQRMINFMVPAALGIGMVLHTIMTAVCLKSFSLAPLCKALNVFLLKTISQQNMASP